MHAPTASASVPRRRELGPASGANARRGSCPTPRPAACLRRLGHLLLRRRGPFSRLLPRRLAKPRRLANSRSRLGRAAHKGQMDLGRFGGELYRRVPCAGGARPSPGTPFPAYAPGTPEEHSLRYNSRHASFNSAATPAGALFLFLKAVVTFVIALAPVYVVAHVWGWLLRWQGVVVHPGRGGWQPHLLGRHGCCRWRSPSAASSSSSCISGGRCVEPPIAP